MTIEELRNKYLALAKKMQTGVAMMMNYNPTDTDPKHLRVGINAAMSDAGGLVTLLISKGIFTEEEYVKSIIDSMQREVDSYTDLVNQEVKEKTGSSANIVLGGTI